MKFSFNIFATAEASDFKFSMQFEFSKAHHEITPRGKSGRALVAMDVPNKRRRTANINVKYTSVIDSHIENNKNWNCEFSCRALRRCDGVLYNFIHSSNFCCFQCVSL